MKGVGLLLRDEKTTKDGAPERSATYFDVAPASFLFLDEFYDYDKIAAEKQESK